MAKETYSEMRRYQRISLPKGMTVAWYGGGQQQACRVKTLGMGGLFLSGSTTPPIGKDLKLLFQVPGGMVQADAVVRNIAPGEGMGVEFIKINPQDRVLLERLVSRLLT
jgi:hypothetical protein